MTSGLANRKLKGDKIIWIIVFVLSTFSVMVVYSAAGWSDLISHFVKLLIGLIAMYITHLIPFKYYSKLGQIGYFTSLLLLLYISETQMYTTHEIHMTPVNKVLVFGISCKIR